MAKTILTNLDFAGNQIQNVVLQLLASGSGITTEGQLFYNSTTKKPNFHNGTSVIALATADDVAAAGGGDMLKSVYDTNNDGVVDVAAVANSVAYANVSGKPATFPPDTHAHAISDVTGLQTALDGKAATSHTHLAADVTDLTTAINTQVVAYWDSLAGADADIDTIRELMDLVKSNAASLTAQVKRFQQTIGNGSATSFTITHSFNTRDVIVQVYNASTYAEVIVDVTRTTVNAVTVAFATAPTTNQYRVVVMA